MRITSGNVSASHESGSHAWNGSPNRPVNRSVLLGIVGLTISLAGRDFLADIIAGSLILVDKPYRVGDRVGLGAIDLWGKVVDIGMISTKILTVDNRMVIVPNSKARQNQIINFSYPDPSYYDTTDIGVAFDNDVEQVEQLLKNGAGSIF